MFRRVDDFVKYWDGHRRETEKLLAELTDESLSYGVSEGHRTIGRMAWHIAQTIPEMGSAVGLEIQGPQPKDPVPATAAAIREAYASAAASVTNEIQSKWNDATLEIEDDLYGETWKRGMTLMALLAHEIHHRGQLTVLMRQAGLRVPGIYGPSKEEWAGYGQPEPVI